MSRFKFETPKLLRISAHLSVVVVFKAFLKTKTGLLQKCRFVRRFSLLFYTTRRDLFSGYLTRKIFDLKFPVFFFMRMCCLVGVLSGIFWIRLRNGWEGVESVFSTFLLHFYQEKKLLFVNIDLEGKKELDFLEKLIRLLN